MQKREPIRIQTGTQRRLMHQAANGEVCHQEAVEFLPDQIRHLTSQDDAPPPQVGF
jgi:hypothetical protein